MIYVILMEPETSGNVGAIARVMKNFDFTKLVLVNPKCDYLNDEALNRSKHGKVVLEKAKVVNNIDGFDYLIATSAKLGSDYNITRTPLMPWELSEKIKNVKGKIGILIGREGYGLFNEEIEKCDFLVNIPSSKKYSTLNISHSVGILLYELFKVKGIAKQITPISKEEKNQIEKMFDQVLDKLTFTTKHQKNNQKKLWKRIIGKSMLSKRESYGVMGFLRKLL